MPRENLNDLLAFLAAAVVDQAWFRPALQGHGGTKCRRRTTRVLGFVSEPSTPKGQVPLA
jgi:hypothetical protein